jgi:nifR3 family TIM-barrel protein
MKPSPTIGPIDIGALRLPINVFYAPLAGCSDYPFRKMSASYFPGLIFCEMVKMEALVRRDFGTHQMLSFDHEMHPIGAQLCGSSPKLAKEAARMIEELGFDVVDLNCGCPVDKVTKDGSGSGLLKNPQLIGEILSNMVASVDIPVTVKIRAGWDENSICAPEIVRIAEQAGAQAITIHGRTREQGYQGSANWDWIKDAKDAASTIKVIGNGDLFSAEAVFRMFSHTNCDGVLISRGTLGEPWIVDDVRALQAGSPLSSKDRKEALLKHFAYVKEYLPERKAIIEMRKVGCWYFKKDAHTKAFREAITKAETLHQIETIIHEFALETEPSFT